MPRPVAPAGSGRILILALLVMLAGDASAPARADVAVAEPGAEAQVSKAVADFLTAFENLDWPAFRAFFADEVTVFFPTPEPPRRFSGRAEVEAQFRRVFDGISRAARGGPPYHRLEPEGLRIEMLGPTAALVTFELHSAERVGRRTLVLRRDEAGWRIVHLHASNVPVAK